MEKEEQIKSKRKLMEVKIKIRLRNSSNRNQKINKKKKSVELKAGCLRKSVQLINLWPGQGGGKKKNQRICQYLV